MPQGDCTPSSIGALLSTAPGALSAKVTHLLSKLRGSRPLLQFSRPLSGPHTNPQTSQASLPHIRRASSHNSLCLEGFNSTPLQPSYRQPAGHLLQGAPPRVAPAEGQRQSVCPCSLLSEQHLQPGSAASWASPSAAEERRLAFPSSPSSPVLASPLGSVRAALSSAVSWPTCL